MSALRSDETLVTVVRSDGCHYCDDAISTLDEFARQYRLRVTAVDAASSAGAALVAEHRAPMFPLVLLDGRYFSHGRLPRRKLAAALQARTRVSAP